ncbi:DUF2380 domain-containing protein [Xanthobacter aminoxidans]|uniref:DUF2380 domain-containing protein n=1 Tax=Xanthobacter aminoxidans TaxID=186280 RepID=UPI003727CBC0
MAIIDFTYSDSSGEPRDQTTEHQARLKAFMASLATDLGVGGRRRVVTPNCDPAPCTLTAGAVPELAEAAKQAGADLLVVGGIHKMSTLVQMAKVEVVSVKAGRVVFQKLYTFRGDNEEAWRRAETFIVGQILTVPQN